MSSAGMNLRHFLTLVFVRSIYLYKIKGLSNPHWTVLKKCFVIMYMLFISSTNYGSIYMFVGVRGGSFHDITGGKRRGSSALLVYFFLLLIL